MDGGLAFADRSDLSITHLVGDFDTIDGTILEKYIHRLDICVHQFIPEKDYTDTDIAVKLALSLIKNHHSEENEEKVIHILGGTGSRLDHVLANLQMLKNILDEDVRGIIIDQNNIIEMIRGERVLKREEMTGTYVSLIPVTMELTGITLSGFKYPLENASSHFGESLMVSNELLEEEGAEAVMPDLLDFMFYSFYNSNYKTDYLGKSKKGKTLSNLGIWALDKYRHTAKKELARSKHFDAPQNIKTLAELAKPFVSLGNQTGEGWFLTGEMMELIHSGAPNIVCTQPFACLPNHVVGKGVIKEIRRQYPEANIVAIDYDPGASEVNQINRIKLMLSTANKNLQEAEEK